MWESFAQCLHFLTHQEGKKPWLLWEVFRTIGEGLDAKSWEHGSCDLLPASSAGWSVCTQPREAVSLPSSHSLLSEAGWWRYYCLFQTIPSLTALSAFWMQLQSFISFLSWHMLVHPWFLVPALASFSYTCLSSACSAFRSLICSKYSLPGFLYVDQFLFLHVPCNLWFT